MKHRLNTRIAIATALCLSAATIAGAQRAPAASAGGSGSFIPGTGSIPGAGAFPRVGSIPGAGSFPNIGFIPGTGFTGTNNVNGFQIPTTIQNGFNPLLSQLNANGMNSGFNNGFNNGFIGFNGFNNGFYGGYSGYPADPTLAFTPYGPMAIGYGYNGYTGTGFGAPSDLDVARALYAQGYQDAANTAAQAAYANAYANSMNNAPSGMTANPNPGLARVPHGSDGVKIWRVGNGQIQMRWQGDSRVASSVTFSITDRNGRTIRTTTVNQLPAEVRFTPTDNAAFYEAVVHYVDGANNTIMGRLP
jgi:hypothetical protein